MRFKHCIKQLIFFYFAASHHLYADESLLAEQFDLCKPRLKQAAYEMQLLPSDVDTVVDQLRYQAKVIEYDRRQPEFVQTFPNYFSKRVNQWRINQGKEQLSKHRDFLLELQKTYGVPPHYIMSFWGLETNFGRYKGKMPVLDSLATLACDQRRSQYFTQEFVVALQLMIRERLDTDGMVGSWAGAMGHTQFMPSAYLNYAIDGDNDGKIDLWNSERDALASAANFLHQLGWTAGLRWGREVILPESFDYLSTGRKNSRPLTEWNTMGVTRANKQDLGQANLSGYIVVPSGHTGPKFIVYDNFATIMRWNNSEFYALAVGKLADQIRGEASLVAPLPELPSYSIADVKQLQHYLNTSGIDVGNPDGIIGPMTRAGIRQLQQQHNFISDGFPSIEVMQIAGVIPSA